MAKIVMNRNEISDVAAGLLRDKGVNVDYVDNKIIAESAKISLTRREIEMTLGKVVKETPWRLLFANREGELKTLTPYEAIVIDEIEEGEEAEADIVTLTAKFDQEYKRSEIDELRSILNLSQNDFIVEAVKNYCENLREQGIGA